MCWRGVLVECGGRLSVCGLKRSCECVDTVLVGTWYLLGYLQRFVSSSDYVGYAF